MRRLAGKSLTEILVVIAIIMILMAIIGVGLRYGVERAKWTSCASNLRQVGVAVALYAEDHSGLISPYFNNGNGHWRHLNSDKGARYSRPDLWRNSYLSYAGTDDVFFCSADPLARQEILGEFDPQPSLYTSFEMLPIFDDGLLSDEGAVRIQLDTCPEAVHLTLSTWPSYVRTPPNAKEAHSFFGTRYLSLTYAGHIFSDDISDESSHRETTERAHCRLAE